MKANLLCFREEYKKILDGKQEKLTHALVFSSIVYFSENFIKLLMDKLGYKYRVHSGNGMLALFTETPDGHVYIAFRGTVPTLWEDWKRILNIVPKKFMGYKAHGGFVIYFNEYEKILGSKIDKEIKENKDKPITFVGHSLGAAIASLFNVKYKNSSNCISFASPNILFNSSYYSKTNKSIRIIKDFVTYIPISLPFIKWTKCAKTINIRSYRNHWNPVGYHKLENYIKTIQDRNLDNL